MTRSVRQSGTLATAVVLLYMGAVTHGGAQSITAPMRGNDRRLETPITLRTSRMRLGQLIEELSRQTGVTVSMDDTTISSGIIVAASIKQTPLAAVMNGIVALAGCRKYAWEWKQTAVPGGFSYRLWAPRMELAAQEWRDRSQDAFERQAAFLIQAVAQPEKDRGAFIASDTNEANRLLAGSSRLLSGVRMFAESLTPEQQLAVLRGQSELTLPLTSLSPRAQADIRADARVSNRPDLLSDHVTFYTKRHPSEPSRTLYIDWGYGAYGYAGGLPLENQLAAEMEAAWNGPGDEHDDAALARSLAPPASATEQEQPNAEGAQTAQLMRAAEAAGVPLLCIVPGAQTDLPSPYGQTLGQYLKAIRNLYYGRVMSKWRDHVLLAAPVSWLLEADGYAAWQPIRQLRDALRPTGTGPDLKLLARLTVPLDSVQIQRYQKEFPDLAMAHRLRAGLMLLDAFPRIETQGKPVPITPPMREVLEQTHVLSEAALAFMTSVRIYKVMKNEPMPHCIEVRFELSHGARTTDWRYTYPERDPAAR